MNLRMKNVNNTMINSQNYVVGGQKNRIVIFLLVLLGVSILLVGCSEPSEPCEKYGCSNNRVGEYFCEEHFACAEDGCENERMLDSVYCKDHYKCAVEDCDGKRYLTSNYCVEHKCSRSYCMEKKFGDYNSCEDHYKCAVDGCENERLDNGYSFCEEHKEQEKWSKNNIKKEGDSNTTIENKNSNYTSVHYPSKLTEEQEMVFWCDALEAVKSNLKAPSTAKFPFAINSDGVEIRYNNTTGIATVYGWVDAENSYGAMLRKEWLVDFKLSEDGKEYQMQHVEVF